MVCIEKINDYLKRNEMTAYQFEKLCELPNGSVYQWNKGVASPSLKAVTKIASHTAIPIAKWLDDED